MTLMKSSTVIAVAAIICNIMTATAETKSVSIRIVETSDVHGAFFPSAATKSSMAKVSTFINSLRAEHGDNVILLDNGDILQGQPVNYYYNFVATGDTNVAAQMTDYLGYDAQTPGNHDIEAGHAVYDKWMAESACRTVCANVISSRTGNTYTDPYMIIERAGVRVAVIGLLTPAIPNWLSEDLWEGLTFSEMTAAARQWVEYVRAHEKPDIIVGLFHSGWEGGIVTTDYAENATREIAESVPGYDIIFFGHDHMARNVSVNNAAGTTVCLNPANSAANVAVAEIEATVTDGKVTVSSITGRIQDVSRLPDDRAYMAHFRKCMADVEAFIERPIGFMADTISTRDCFFGSAPFTDFIHNAQLKITGADISLNAPLAFDSYIPKGTVTVNDMFKLYKYENKLYVMEMTGEEVRKHLEMSYDQWVNTMASPDDHIMKISQDTRGDSHRYGFENMTFNFDSAAGIDYVVDVTKPDGQKVTILRMSNGQPFDEQKTYRVVMNSYRAAGGGELLTRGAGIPKEELDARTLFRSERDLRHYLMEEIERAGTVSPEANGNWTFAPEEWTAPAIERDRKLLFPRSK